MQPIWQYSGILEKKAGKRYVNHSFEVTEETACLKVHMSFVKNGQTQVYPSLFSPIGYRGTRMKPGAMGQVNLELELSEHYASVGGLSGLINKGIWRIQLDVQWIDEDLPYTITVETGDAKEQKVFEVAVHNGREGKGTYQGYYRGELHAHTNHSDGSGSVSEVVAAARKYGLDYFALTDHFSSSSWEELASLSDEQLMVMKGIELTGHWGHGNLHGLSGWVDTFIDDCTTRTINDVIDDTHAQGGLFSVNHAFSLNLGWRYHELDWSKVDLFEIYHHLTGSNNLAQLGLWDSLLNQGYKITGVGATDSHHPHMGLHRLGQVFTYVQSEALTPKALIEGLKTGDAYVSFGANLSFSASSDNLQVGMGQTLAANGNVDLSIKLSNLEQNATLLVMKNGLHFANLKIPAGEFELELTDTKPSKGYYRLELYAQGRDSTFEAVREWDKTLLLSNPIFVA